MMKRAFIRSLGLLVAGLLLCVQLVACTQGTQLTLEEQLELGVRYLGELDYENAVIAFTAAIEIDPKSAQGYAGLYTAYTALGDTETADEVWAAMLEAGVSSDEVLTWVDTMREDAGIKNPSADAAVQPDQEVESILDAEPKDQRPQRIKQIETCYDSSNPSGWVRTITELELGPQLPAAAYLRTSENIYPDAYHPLSAERYYNYPNPGTLSLKDEWTYDMSGVCTQFVSTNAILDITNSLVNYQANPQGDTGTEEYKYDGNGNIVQITVSSMFEANVNDYLFFDYDEQEKVIRYASAYSVAQGTSIEEHTSYITYLYDENGRLIEQHCFDPTGKEYSYSTFTYEDFWPYQESSQATGDISFPLLQVQPTGIVNEELRLTYVTTASPSLNVRTGPGTNYDRLVQLPEGTIITGIGVADGIGGWIVAEYSDESGNKSYGWVSAEYIERQ